VKKKIRKKFLISFFVKAAYETAEGGKTNRFDSWGD